MAGATRRNATGWDATILEGHVGQRQSQANWFDPDEGVPELERVARELMG